MNTMGATTYRRDFDGSSTKPQMPSLRPRQYSGGQGAPSKPMPSLNQGYGVPAVSSHVAPVQQTTRMAGNSKYSTTDWTYSNIDHYNSADASRNNSERVRNEAVRLINEREEKTVTTQRDADRRIGERIQDETFWRSELQAELERNINETNLLMATKKALEKALAETDGPLKVNTENIYNREGRQGIDMVNDQVENSLHREVGNIQACQNKMIRTLEQVGQQLQENRDARHALERDLAQKDHSINIDHTVHNLQNMSRNINLHQGIESVDRNITVPETWAEHSNRNIQISQAARNRSQLLRGDVDNLITSCANDMWSHWNQSNMNFQQRITETTDAHNKLQSQLSKTMQEIYDQEKHIESLRKALRDKAPPLKVAQTRLEHRTHRPDVELCRDNPHHRLVQEVGEIQDSIDMLNRKLQEAEIALEDLLRNKARLEHDLKVKSNSLFIDREKCLSIRKSFPVQSLATKL